MKNIILVWSGIWRKPLRTIFTFVSIVVAFLLFGLLSGITAGLDSVIDQLGANRLRVRSNASRVDRLPISYASQIERLPHIDHLQTATYLGGYFREPKNAVGGLALGGESRVDQVERIKVDPADLKAFETTRTAALVGSKLAAQYGWKKGDRIPLSSLWKRRDGSTTWTFDIVGIFEPEDVQGLANEFWFHYDYLDEGRASGRGTVNFFKVHTAGEQFNDQVAASIDALFATSADPTLTQSEREWARTSLNQALDLNLMVTAIVGASLFTLLFITGSTMIESVRQRIPELAVLKTIGYTNRSVYLLIFSETLTVCVLGAGLGLAVARGLFPFVAPVYGGGKISMPPEVFVIGMAIAVGVALLSSAIPGTTAARLSIVNALARRR